MKKNVFGKLIAFLADLEKGKIHYTLAHQRDNAIMVIVVVPGERWEVEFFEDGSVETERFVSNGEIYGEEALNDLLTKYSDREHDRLESPQDVGLTSITEYQPAEQV
jgi:hypothetical protein